MSSINSAALDRLRKSLSPSASANLPGDPDYSNKRWALNAEKPAAIVACPATAEDVAQILAFSQGKAPYEDQQKLALAVKGGGHTPSGASSSDGGLVIDLQPKMHDVRVDPAAKLAYVGGGCLWADVDDATAKHGLASVSGVVSHTGVGGLTLGGGFGWLCSQYGLVIDNLVQVTLVTSSSEILTASESENTDLFWAVRGGGGNFGVVTEFVLKLYDQRPDLYTSVLIYPPPLLEKIVPEINAWLTERTPAENAHLIFAIGPNGQPAFMLQLVYNGDSDTGAKKFERFVKLGPVVNQTETIPYLKLNRMQDPLAHHGSYRLLQGNFVPAVPSGLPLSLVTDMFGAWHKFVTENPAASPSVLIFELYHPGKWSSIPPEATAYVHRKPTFNVAYLIHWTDPSFTEHAAGVTQELDQAYIRFRDAHFPRELVGEGGYTNYLDDESRKASQNSEFTSRRFGRNFERLVEVKKRYDPGNLFGRWFAVPT